MKHTITSPTTCIDLLKKLYPESSRRTLKNWLKNGRFSLNDEVVKRENLLLEPGQILSDQKTTPEHRIENIKILFEDRYVIAVEKPHHLLSVPLDESLPGSKHVLGILRSHFGSDQIFAVHRLDREASGVMIFAKGLAAREKIKQLFEVHDIERHYFAVVQGIIPQDSGSWTRKLRELESYHVVESPDGKEAITHFQVLYRSTKYTYLQLKLETGRKHQIRVHTSLEGHPILGDRRYGSSENPIRRLSLHAISLQFVHPFTSKKLSFVSPIPEEFKKILPPQLRN